VQRRGERQAALMCMTRMDQFRPGEPITVAPMKAFP
jgi:succinate dehydrogenase/fumarate reductase-like Fe-S protein